MRLDNQDPSDFDRICPECGAINSFTWDSCHVRYVCKVCGEDVSIRKGDDYEDNE